MITDYLLRFFVFLAKSLLGVIDALIPNPPGWWSGVHDAFAGVSGFITPAGWWLPTGMLLTVALSILGINLVHVAMVLVRRIASYMTLGGGSL